MRELTEQEIVRREKLQNIKNPYPERYEITHEICDAANLEDGVTGVRVAGRIILMRKMGKMSFLTIGDINGKIQVSVKLDMIGEEAYQEFKSNYDLGDFIGVVGEVFTTHTGEKTIRADEITFLGKALKPLPEKFHGIEDIETIYRERYLDLIMNDEAKKKFLLRSKFIREIRNYLDEAGYIEIETPILNNKASGATARPFITHHNALDHRKGLMMLITSITWTVSSASATLKPVSFVTGAVRAKMVQFTTSRTHAPHSVSFLMFRLASSMRPAPMQIPTTVIMPVPMAVEGMEPIYSSTVTMAFAAMAVVPSVETVLCTISLPNWNMAFSMPVGRPMLSTRKITFQSTRRSVRRPISISLPGWHRKIKMAMVASTKEISVAMAAPATPMSKTNISTAFPMTFNMLEHTETIMGRRVLPDERKMAALALNSAING